MAIATDQTKACLDIAQIRKLLPQRYPFLMIDRVVEIEKKRRVLCYKNLTINEPFFQGHFPDYPVMPGVLIIEAMAQASGVLGFWSLGKAADEDSIYLLVGSDNVRFKKPVLAGDRLWIESSYLTDKRGIWKFSCVAQVDDKVVCSATILCADRPL